MTNPVTKMTMRDRRLPRGLFFVPVVVQRLQYTSALKECAARAEYIVGGNWASSNHVPELTWGDTGTCLDSHGERSGVFGAVSDGSVVVYGPGTSTC